MSVFIDAKLTGSVAGDIEEEKAVHDGQFTFVHDWKKAVLCMLHKIGDRHLAACDKCCKPCQQAKKDQDSAPEFNDGCCQHQRVVKLLLPAEGAKQLLRSVAREHESRNNPQGSESDRFEPAQKFHSFCFPFTSRWLLSVTALAVTCRESLDKDKGTLGAERLRAYGALKR